MKRQKMLSTAMLLSFTLAWPLALHAGPKAKNAAPQPGPTSDLTQTEQECRALGLFAYNRATERDSGTLLSDGLIRSRQWDASHQVRPVVRAWHDSIHQAVYAAITLTPMRLRQLTEVACLQEADAAATPPKAQDSTNWRY